MPPLSPLTHEVRGGPGRRVAANGRRSAIDVEVFSERAQGATV
jgi:hypothetical protein